MFKALFLSAALVASNVLASPLHSSVDNPSSLFPRATGCSTSVASCQNTTAQINLCCFEAPGGQFLQTQFWDTNPSLGPSNSWTIHGLWPDQLMGFSTGDGTYDQFCDAAREYPSITNVLKNNGRTDLLNYMNQYWLDNAGDNESFWEHEWNKHGTCMSTLRTSCLPAGSTTGLDAVNYFDAAVKLFKGLPTYTYLSAAGITPGTTKYTLAQLTSAVKAKWGFTPAFDCTSSTISSISYYYNLKGSAIDGVWVPINAPKAGTCPSTGIAYPSKTGTPTTTGTATPTPTGVPAKSTITVTQSSGTSTGCLLSYGTWSTQTCATLTATTSGSGFTLSSSRGLCAISTSGLSCASTITTGTVFTATTSGGKTLLTYGGSTAFTADSVPSGTTQITLYSGTARAQDVTLVLNAV